MADKAYIVANEEQVTKIRETAIHEDDFDTMEPHCFPYVLVNTVDVGWMSYPSIDDIDYDIEIVYDGRKENKMSKKYVVAQVFMNELNEWLRGNVDRHVVAHDLYNMPDSVVLWWLDPNVSDKENNNRLIAIVRWVNGEDVFEVEKPKKWVVRSQETDDDGDYRYVFTMHYGMQGNAYSKNNATRFDTKEEAESWANAHQEVIEVEA